MDSKPDWYGDPKMSLLEMAFGGRGISSKDSPYMTMTNIPDSKIAQYLTELNTARTGGRITTAMAKGITDKFEKEYESDCNCPGKRTKYGYIKKCDCKDNIQNIRRRKRNANPAGFEAEERSNKRIRSAIDEFQNRKGGSITYKRSWYDGVDDFYRSALPALVL